LGIACTVNSEGNNCKKANKCTEYYLDDYTNCNSNHPTCTTNLTKDSCVPYLNTCDLNLT